MGYATNISFPRATAASLVFPWVGSGSAPSWIIAASLSFTLRQQGWPANGSTAPVLQVTSSQGSITVDGAGNITVSLTLAQTQISPGSYSYDLERTDAGSEAQLAQGSCIVTQSQRIDQSGSPPGSQQNYSYLLQAQDLGDLHSVITARANLGLGDTINAALYGFTGSGTTQDLANLQAAASAAAGKTLLIPPGTYSVNGTLTLSGAHTRVSGYGAKLIQTAATTQTLYVTGSDVTVEGLWLYGLGTDWNTNSHTNAIGIYVNAASCSVRSCRIENHGCAGVQLYQATNALVEGCSIIGVGAAGGLVALSNYCVGVYGYVSGLGYAGVRIIGNDITGVTQAIFLGTDFSEVTISANVIDLAGVGQHGLYLASLVGAAISGNSISNVPDTGIKVQLTSSCTLNGKAVVVTGNTINSPGVAGISFLLASGSLEHQGVTVAGNDVVSAGQYGINLQACDDYAVSDNGIEGSGAYGIYADNSNHDGAISDNVIESTAWTAIYAAAASGYRCVVRDNALFEVCSAGGAQTYQNVFLYLQGPGEVDARGNVVRCNNPAPAYSIAADATSSVALYDNDVPSLRSDGATIIYMQLSGTIRGMGGPNHGPPTSYPNTGVRHGRGPRRDFHASAPPPNLGDVGCYQIGDRCINSNPVAGGVTEWECTTASVPGTNGGGWEPMGYLPNVFKMTTAAVTLSQNNDLVEVNYPGAATITLPTAAQMSASVNKVLTIKDISGAAGTNNISFVAGSGTSLEQPNTIAGNYGFVRWYLDGTVWRTR